MDWKKKFSRTILERGNYYFKQKHVHILYTRDSTYNAMVMGTSIYHVEIEIEKGEAVYMSCSCPHAEKGYYCKHMAAVLFYYDELFADEDENEGEEDVFTLDEFWRGDFLAQALYSERRKKERAVCGPLPGKPCYFGR